MSKQSVLSFSGPIARAAPLGVPPTKSPPQITVLSEHDQNMIMTESDEMIERVHEQLEAHDRQIANERFAQRLETVDAPSVPYVTPLQRVAILGKRTDQLLRGAQATIPLNTTHLTHSEVAHLEFELRTIPMHVIQPVDGEKHTHDFRTMLPSHI